jgi:ribonuclease P protein component
MRYTLGKPEKLKSRKLIGRLFEEGKSVKKFPVRLVYLQTDHTSDFPIQVGFSVPKRNFKRAVDRNRIKRLFREAYRHQKGTLYEQLSQPYIFMFTFIGKREPTYVEMEQKIQQVLALFIKAEKSQSDEENQN